MFIAQGFQAAWKKKYSSELQSLSKSCGTLFQNVMTIIRFSKRKTDPLVKLHLPHPLPYTSYARVQQRGRGEANINSAEKTKAYHNFDQDYRSLLVSIQPTKLMDGDVNEPQTLVNTCGNRIDRCYAATHMQR